MSNQQTLVIIMEGGDEPHVEQRVSVWMRNHRDKITIETIQKFSAIPGNHVNVVVCTNRETILMYCRENQVQHVATSQNLIAFDYLQTLQSVCNTFANETYHSAIVLGGTALPLANVDQLQYLVESMGAEMTSGTVWANNPISPDVVGWNPVSAITGVQRVQNDNELAAALRDQAGYQLKLWNRELSLTYDIDTPIDILVSNSTMVTKEVDPLFENAFRAITRLQDAVQEKALPNLTLIGRVSPHTVTFLNQEMKARVRVFSEERGMKGLRRDQDGLVWSLVADWFERFDSYDEAFAQLAKESDGIVMDTRVWMAHHRLLEVTDEDRFASDLLLVNRIEKEKLRRLTDAAFNCSVPVLLGGFGLVNQGIQMLFQK